MQTGLEQRDATLTSVYQFRWKHRATKFERQRRKLTLKLGIRDFNFHSTSCPGHTLDFVCSTGLITHLPSIKLNSSDHLASDRTTTPNTSFSSSWIQSTHCRPSSWPDRSLQHRHSHHHLDWYHPLLLKSLSQTHNSASAASITALILLLLCHKASLRAWWLVLYFSSCSCPLGSIIQRHALLFDQYRLYYVHSHAINNEMALDSCCNAKRNTKPVVRIRSTISCEKLSHRVLSWFSFFSSSL